ncbi:hypothetical protein J6590_044201 [Homalodisca vitripennis]|nr:hypothetical protein J6590_044201 [Homalodisca vitripennis]
MPQCNMLIVEQHTRTLSGRSQTIRALYIVDSVYLNRDCRAFVEEIKPILRREDVSSLT